MTKVKFYSLEQAHLAKGAVVVVDVLRAFTSAAYAFNGGAVKILPVSSVEDALQLKMEIPGSLIMGEVKGYKPEFFDIGNSPAEVIQNDFDGKTVIQRTSAGTQGLVKAVNADCLLAASFVVARATASFLHRIDPALVSFVITGESSEHDGDEDRACGDYIAALINNEQALPDAYTARVMTSTIGKGFLSGQYKYFSQEDFRLSTRADVFDFFLPVRRQKNRLVMEMSPTNNFDV